MNEQPITRSEDGAAIEVLDAPDRIAALAGEWRELWWRSACTPFQLPEWIIPWWRWLGSGEPVMLIIRSAGELVGLAPLFIYQDPDTRERVVLLFGTGITDYLDVVAAPGAESVCAAAVSRWLNHNRSRWDRCDFQELRPGSPLLASAPLAGCEDGIVQASVCPYLALTPERGDALAAIPRRERSRLQYYHRRIGRIEHSGFESATDQPGRMEGLLDALFRLHAARWRERDMPGVLADSAIEEFHRSAAKGLLGLGLLRLYGLRVGGKIAGVFYGFTDRQRTYYYLSGFDPALEKLNLGTAIVGHAIERAAGEGHTEFDFLRGAESYKYRWGARGRISYRRVIRPCGARASTPSAAPQTGNSEPA